MRSRPVTKHPWSSQGVSLANRLQVSNQDLATGGTQEGTVNPTHLAQVRMSTWVFSAAA